MLRSFLTIEGIREGLMPKPSITNMSRIIAREIRALHYYKKYISPQVQNGFYLGYATEVTKGDMKTNHLIPWL